MNNTVLRPNSAFLLKGEDWRRERDTRKGKGPSSLKKKHNMNQNIVRKIILGLEQHKGGSKIISSIHHKPKCNENRGPMKPTKSCRFSCDHWNQDTRNKRTILNKNLNFLSNKPQTIQDSQLIILGFCYFLSNCKWNQKKKVSFFPPIEKRTQFGVLGFRNFPRIFSATKHDQGAQTLIKTSKTRRRTNREAWKSHVKTPVPKSEETRN